MMSQKLKKIFFYSANPKILWFKIRERIRCRFGKKNKIHKLDNLPIVKLQIANKNICDLIKVLNIYINNPSPMTISPNNMEMLYHEVSLGTEFYLAYDANDFLIGAIGWQPWRNMVVNLVVDYKCRSKGFAMACLKSLISLKKTQGVQKVNVQVYKNNWRAQNLMFSLGFFFEKDIDKEVNVDYISLTIEI
jgi:ribosomal protein S18 acetylase RimI-like enzyme